MSESTNMHPAVDVTSIRKAALTQLAQSREDLETLVRIPSVSGEAFDQSEVDRTALAVADLLRDAGMPEVDILRADRPDGTIGAPAVVARRPAPEGKPTVLLYAHHDVMPAGDETQWDSPPFEPTERNGRLYGRGTGDDKAGIMVHLNTIRTLLPSWTSPEDGIGITVFIEGEEEIGSPSFVNFLNTYTERLTADLIIVADSDNWTVDTPSLTASLRGSVIADVTVNTLGWAQHSGFYGGSVPDAHLAATKLLATLWDDEGSVAVAGLHQGSAADLPYDEEQLRKDTGLLDSVEPIGTGPILERMWTKPAITLLGTNATSLEEASSTLRPTVTWRLSLRVAPGQDAAEAFAALEKHLLSNAPFGADVVVECREQGQPFQAPVEHPIYGQAQSALEHAWDGTKPVLSGMGGSIPFIADFASIFPDAVVLVTGIEDPDTRAHGANESLDLSVFRRAAIAEALLLANLAESGMPTTN